MTWKLAYNTTDSPVVIDEEGHVLGGHEWRAVDDSTEPAQRATARGALQWPDAPIQSMRDDVAAEARRAADLNSAEQAAEHRTPVKPTAHVNADAEADAAKAGARSAPKKTTRTRGGHAGGNHKE